MNYMSTKLYVQDSKIEEKNFLRRPWKGSSALVSNYTKCCV